MALTIRKGDSVIILSGKEKGKRGKVLRLSADGSRAYIEGVNLVKRFVRKTRQNPQGGLMTSEASIHLSNLALYNDKLSRGVRFRTRILADGSKTRVCVKSGQELSRN
jgi:large subunit ribosomal protein L24